MGDYINKKKINIINQVKVILENKLEESFIKFEKDFDEFIKKKGRFKEKKIDMNNFSVDDVIKDDFDDNKIKKENNIKIVKKNENINKNNENEKNPPQTITMNSTLINYINLNKSQQFNRNYNINNKPSNKFRERISLPVLLNSSKSQKRIIFTPPHENKKVSFFSPSNTVSTSIKSFKNNQNKSRNLTSNSIYFNSLSNKNYIVFDKDKYIKDMETNNSYFTNEMIKIAGINAYNYKNNNKYFNRHLSIDNEIDKKLLIIESEKKPLSVKSLGKSIKSTEPNSKNESSLSLTNINKITKNSYNSPSRMTQINMKYFRVLRKGKSPFNY
jgi:hypothetical protein